MANKLKIDNIMSTVKKADRCMTIRWQEIANEIIKGIFLKDNEMVVCDNYVLIAEESAIRLNEIEGYIKILKPNKPPGPDGIKAEIYQGTSDITALFLIQIIKDFSERGYFPTHHEAELSLIYKAGDKDPQNAK